MSQVYFVFVFVFVFFWEHANARARGCKTRNVYGKQFMRLGTAAQTNKATFDRLEGILTIVRQGALGLQQRLAPFRAIGYGVARGDSKESKVCGAALLQQLVVLPM